MNSLLIATLADPESATDIRGGEDFASYRALSTGAVCSVVMGLLSGLAFLDWTMAVVPVVGMLVGASALVRIRARPAELAGAPLAWAGTALSLGCLVGGLSLLTYTYLTEVPEGYSRISYEALQPDDRVQGQLVPSNIGDLEGKPIFIKGFMFPGRKTTGLNDFLLVRDRGSCCFGGNPKLTDRIRVKLKNPQGVDYTTNEYKIAGTFRLKAQPTEQDVTGGVYYELSEAEVR